MRYELPPITLGVPPKPGEKKGYDVVSDLMHNAVAMC